MNVACPRCGHQNPAVGRYCGHCGLRIELGADGPLGAGRVAHRVALEVPDGFAPIANAVDLHYRWQAAGGGRPLLGTESLEVIVFNAGYDLARTELSIIGAGSGGVELFATHREIPVWRRGDHATLDVPSWELPDRVVTLSVALRSAEFAAEA